MARLLARALRTRQRPLKEDVEIPIGRAIVVLKARYTHETVERAAVGRNHNQRRSAVGRELANRLANEYYERFVREGVDEINAVGELADLIRATPQFQWSLERIGAALGSRTFARPLRRAGVVARGRTGLRERRGVGAVAPGAFELDR